MIARLIRGSAHTALAVSLASLPLVYSSAAYAQDAATPEEEQQVAGDSGDIIVTAQRREQRLQDVPVAVSAFGEVAIAARQAVQIGDLMKVTPNTQVASPFGEGGPPNFVIRGISSTDYSANQSKPIAVYIDEGIRGLSTFETMPLFDVERVEVLRGPQGTLYGKNATGGAVNIVTKKPSFSTEGYVTGSYGNFNRVRLQGAVQAPLIDGVLAVRVAALYVHDTGVLENVTPGLGDLDQTDVFAFRGALQFEPSNSFEATLRYNHVRSGGRNYAPFAGNIDFNDPAILFPGNNLSGLPGSNRNGLGFFQTATTNTPERTIRSDGLNLIMNWDASDVIRLTSVTTYDWGKWVDIGDDDGLVIEADDPIVTFGRDIKQFVQELRLATSFDGPFNAQAGLFYSKDSVNAGFDYSLLTDPGCGPACSFGFTPTGTGFVQSNSFDQERKSYAAYLRGDLEITETVSVYGGVRFSRDKVAVANFNAFLGDNIDPLAFPTISGYSDRSTFSNTSFEVGVNWKPSDDVLLYASMREGYRSGAVNAQAFSDPSEITFAPPETARTYEAGFKSTLLDRTLTINGSLFQTDYRNQQVVVTEAGGLFPLRSISGARVRGIEAEITARPIDRVTLGVGIGALDPEYDNDAVVSGSSGTIVAGNQISNSAKFSLNLTGGFVLAEIKDGTVDLNIDASYTSRIYFDIAQTTAVSQKGYWVSNARIAYNGDRFSVGAGVKNLFNQKYFNYGLALRFAGLDYLIRGTPRTYGVDATFRF
ncbi:TonB-dependent receptor [Sphingorhabdus buctiana]|uniref:TonB-dependent receptor n=2 Tax=Sphingorhabdus TaxID=1434046 RepID=A0A6I6LDG4_9SPHN|nr:TonB-dependent receptor [Sphingorhabdus lacus]QGY80373.1 TonB-dependent receptor [Sphingorhabdus lacus]